jgi:uncharacterized protein YjbK
MKSDHLEVELKLLIDEKGHRSLLSHLPQEGPNLQQTNYFFDTPSSELRTHRWALRCREENGQFTLTCKGPSTRNEEGISSRPEIEAPTSKEVLRKLNDGVCLSEIDHIATQHLSSLFGDLQVSPLLHFHNDRRRLPWHEGVIELDHSTCLGSHRYEIELEASEADLAKWAPKLEDDLQNWKIPFTRAQDSKMKWATSMTETKS